MNEKNKKTLSKSIKKIRKAIPEKYNQLDLLDYLSNEEIDLIVSITSRGDGKSYNWLKALIYLAYKHDIITILLTSHFTLRSSYMGFIEKVLMEDKELGLSSAKFAFRRNDDFITILYDKKPIFYISDLNSASDLKYYADTLQNASLMLYDEFLKLDGDYVMDEDEKLKIIYETVDRGVENDFIKKCKIILLGNPVNFNSPLLSRLGLYKCLERQSINSIHRYDNIVLEKRRNDEINEEKNLRLFKDYDDNMLSGEFIFNDYLLANDKQIMQHSESFSIKLEEKYLNVRYDEKYNIIVGISAIPLKKDYHFTNYLNYMKKGVHFMDKKYFKESFIKKYEKLIIKYEDAFSLAYIDKHSIIKQINLYKCLNIIMFERKQHEEALKSPDDIIYDELRLIKQKLAKEYL